MHILFIAGRELDYPRNDVLLRAFRRIGQVDVVGENKRPGSLVFRSLQIVLKSLPKLLFGYYDLIFVGFYGHMIMLVVGVLSRSPVLFDVFVSTYDTLVFDRGGVTSTSLIGKLAFWLDRTACRLADHLILDTKEHVVYFVQTFGLSDDRFSVLPVGCNEEIFSPPENFSSSSTHTVLSTLVLFYSTYLPLHGVEIIIRAAARMKEEAVHFRLIGDGQEYPKAYQLAKEFKLENLTFVPFVPLENLPTEIATATICLGGHFGRTEKAKRVIPSKVYQILPMNSTLIAADTPANRGMLTHGESAYLCPPGDAEALAEAILALHRNPFLREALGAGGRAAFEVHSSEAVITEGLRRLVQRMLEQT